MPTPATLAELLQLLHAGTPLLLPTARSARELRHAYDLHQRARSIPAWQPPPVFTWQQWTTGLWQDFILSGHETRLLLNPAQEHTLWREVISATPAPTPGSALTSPDALAELASSALALAAAHNALPRLRSASATSDTRTFAAWADDFTRLCANRACLASAQLDHALLQHLEAATLAAPTTLHLVDHTHPTPAQTTLLKAFRAHGTLLHHHTLTAAASAPRELHHLLAPTPQDELAAAARIARQLLEANPAARIALLVPGLAEDAPAIEPILRDILAPELHHIAADLSSTPWEIAPSTPLATLPLIATALDLARLAATPLPLERISALLLSPYLGESTIATATRESIASFDTRILRKNTPLRPELDLPGLLSLLDSPRARNLPHSAALPLWPRHAHATLQRATLARPRSFADWTELLRDLLRAAAWPGPRPPTALETAAARAWDDALDLIATLDFSGRPVPYATALDALTRQLQTSAFTPPATHAPVQVITPNEAAGCLFDAVLFLRCTDANWPASQRPHPLLPWSLQRSLAMPGTDPARSTALALDLTTALIARTPTVIFTSAAADAEGQLRPSPLLATLNIPSSITVPDSPSAEPIALETHLDDTPLPALPDPYVHGGARVLQLQAACGFRAFAEFRLSATEPESSTLGLDARESGNRLHQVLQLFWNRVPSQQALRDLTPAQRDQHLRSAIDDALHLRLHGPWDEAYIAVQKQRLFTLLSQWLTLELDRSPFTVLSSEDAQEIAVGPLTLSVRVDRIDQVAGGVLFVDYKTGLSPHPKAWDEDRPDEPQLPLYASFLPQPEELRGLAFAKVRPGSEMKWLGVQSEPGILPASRSNLVIDMPVRVEDWRQVLTVLADDFAEGRAYVRPKSFALNCAHCGQRLLCRLDPATLLATFSEDDDTESSAEAGDA